MRRTIYVLTLLLWPSFLCAQQPKTPENKPVQLEKGKRAPYAGVLMTDALAIGLGQKANQCPAIVVAEVKKARALMQVDVDEAEKNLEIEKELAGSKEELLRRHVDGAEKWYRAPVFVAASASLLTVAAILVARETVIVK